MTSLKERRVELGDIFKNEVGIPNVYFQPPSNHKIQYPAIIYSRTNIEYRNADNERYRRYARYTVNVIDKNPDSEYVEKISLLPYCNHERHYTKDNMNYDVFTIYY